MKSVIRPRWPDLFNKKVSKLLKKAQKQRGLKNGRNDPYWYDYDCETLSGLKKTGRGNCVAWSELAVELAEKCVLKSKQIIIGDRTDKDQKKNSHQITLIYELDGSIWYQSCISIKRLYRPRGKEDFERTKKLVCQVGARDCEWKHGAVVLRVF